MIGSTRNLHAWAYAAPADLRKGFDGLHGLVTQQMDRDPLSGDCYLFTNRKRTSAKVLLWDGTGLCVYHKRLSRGRFPCLWQNGRNEPLSLTLSELALFLEGCRLVGSYQLSPSELRI